MKQTALERQLVLDVVTTRAGCVLSQAGLWRWEHMKARAEADYHEGYLKRRAARRERWLARDLAVLMGTLGVRGI